MGIWYATHQIYPSSRGTSLSIAHIPINNKLTAKSKPLDMRLDEFLLCAITTLRAEDAAMNEAEKVTVLLDFMVPVQGSANSSLCHYLFLKIKFYWKQPYTFIYTLSVAAPPL